MGESKLDRLESGQALASNGSGAEGREKTYFGYGSRSLKLLFCFAGLQASYIAWGITQEQLMTQEYAIGKFKSSAFCVFGNRFLALFIALGIVLYRRQFAVKGQAKEAPFHWYAPSSISNTHDAEYQRSPVFAHAPDALHLRLSSTRRMI